MIKIKRMPAVIEPEFVVAVISCARYRIREYAPHVSNRKYSNIIRCLAPIAAGDKSAIDEMMTRLRKQKYVRFYMDDDVFVGETTNLVMTADKDHKWNIGKYLVRVPKLSVEKSVIDAIHVFPCGIDVSNIHAYHPHQTATGTCWSQWGSVVYAMMRNVSPDLIFGTMISFLESYNQKSPLARPPDRETDGGQLYWMKPMSREEIREWERER